MNRAGRALIALCLIVSLAACGGGGGGGNSGGGGGGGNNVTGITITPSSLTFTANHDDANLPPAQTVTITALGSGTTYIRFENGTATGLTCNGTSSCTYQVQPTDAPYSFVNASTRTNGLTFIGCADQVCATGAVPGGRQTVTYTYTVTPGLDFAPNAPLTVNGVEGVAPPPQTIAIAHPSGTVPAWHATFSPVGGGPSFVTLTPSGAGASSQSPTSFQAQFGALPAGTYTGTIDVQPGTTPRLAKRSVTYVVQSALSVTGNLSFVIDETTGAGALQQTLTLTAAPGVVGSLGWTARSTPAWLHLSQTTGDTGANNQLVVSLPTAQLERLPKGVYTADITLDPSVPAQFSPATIHVALDMRLPHTEFVMPHVVEEGSTGEAFVRGSGFAALPGTVNFGSTPAVSPTRDSDTSIRANFPPTLAAGPYAVDLSIPANQLLLDRERARLTVANTKAVAGNASVHADLASTGRKYALLFDDARLALYIANVKTASPSAGAAIGRLVWNGSGWTADGLTVDLLRDIVLSPGGDELLALTADDVTRVDVSGTSLSVLGAVSLPTNPTTPLPAGRSFAAGNDGRLLISQSDVGTSSNIVYYDLGGDAFSNEFLCCVDGNVRASADGSVIYLLGQSGTYRFDVKTRTYTSNSASGGATGKALSVSRTGARFLVDGTHVFNSDLSSRGTLSAVEPLTAGVITADGARAYAYADSGTLYAFDLETFNGSGGFAALGSPVVLSDPVGASPVMTTSVDGRLVFIAGDDRVIVQAAPP